MLTVSCLVAATVVASLWASSLPLLIYPLSYWHYALYWLAYRHGTVPAARFRRDAVVMKAMALAALAVVYGPLEPNALSIAVVAAGFGLNTWAALVLGHARSYYGVELGVSSRVRVTALPYSLVPHPMLLGNVAAFGGTLIHPDFRSEWWPLAFGHVLLNVGLWQMETRVRPLGGRPARPRPSRRDLGRLVTIAAVGGLAAGAALALIAGAPRLAGPWALVLSAAAVHTAVTWFEYTWPRRSAGTRPFDALAEAR